MFYRKIAYTISGIPEHSITSVREALNVAIQNDNKLLSELSLSLANTFRSVANIGPSINLVIYVITTALVTTIFSIYLLNPVNRYTINIKEYINYFKKNYFEFLTIAFILGGIGGLLSQLIALLVQSSSVSTNQATITASLTVSPIITLIPVVILAPIVEEIIFRGVLMGFSLKIFERNQNTKQLSFIFFGQQINISTTEIVVLLISSTLFALIHLSTSFTQWPYFPAYFFGGVAFGYIYLKGNRRISTNIILHSSYNLIPITIQFFLKLFI